MPPGRPGASGSPGPEYGTPTPSWTMIYSHALFEELCENYHIHPNSEKKAVYFSQIIASNILTAVKWWQLESSQTSEKEILEMIVLTVTKGILPSLYEQFW